MDIPIALKPDAHQMVVIYANPADFPGKFVARTFYNGKPTEISLVTDDLWELQLLVAWNNHGMKFFKRHYWDDPVIVGMWM